MRAHTRKSSSLSTRRSWSWVPTLILGCALVVQAQAEDWYTSDQGMIAYRASSRSVALRSPWALSVAALEPASLWRSVSAALGDRWTPALSPEVLSEVEGLVRRRGYAKVELAMLYKDRNLYRSRYSAWDAGKQMRLSVELEGAEAHPSARVESYDDSGRLSETIEIADDGLATILSLSYQGMRLASSTSRSSSGEQTGETSYRYSRSGSLRQVDASGPSNSDEVPSSSSLVLDTAEAVPRRIVTSGSSGAFEGIYDGSGRLVRETTDQGTTEYERAPDGRLLSSRFKGKDDTGWVKTAYDDTGNAVSETLLDETGAEKERASLEWKDGHLITRKTEKGGEAILIRYEYGSGDEPIRETTYKSGILERELLRPESEKEIERLYRNGEVVLERTYRQGRKVREDTYRGGKVIMTRRFE